MELCADVLNTGLHLAMEWGAKWLEPIQERLKQLHPELTLEQLDNYDSTCRAAMKRGHDLVPECLGGDFDTEKAFPKWKRRMREAYPWISDENLDRNFSQGCYYAMK